MNIQFCKKCTISNFRPSFSKPVLPNISSDKDGNADEILRKDSLKGLEEKFKINLEVDENKILDNKKFLDYKDRLDHELKIERDLFFFVFSQYFL